MNIKILGTGCAKCHTLEKVVKEVITEQNINATIEEIRDLNKILKYPILTTPGLVINEKVVSSGHVPGKKDVEKLILSALEKE